MTSCDVILGPYVKQFGLESADKQTDWTDFTPSTADVGGNNLTKDLALLDWL